MIVGITGGYCSGKNTVSKIFERHGFKIIDVDSIGHKALDVKKDEIIKAFGSELVVNGSIDRKRLGRIVFSNKERLKKLENIVHPWMIKEVKKDVKNCSKCVINAALLIEMCLFTLCDFVIGVESSIDNVIERAMARDGLSKEDVIMRIQNQIPVKEKKHYVDIVIENNGDLKELEKKVLYIIRKICSKGIEKDG